MEENKETPVPRMLYMNEPFHENRQDNNMMQADRGRLQNPVCNSKNPHSTTGMSHNGEGKTQMPLMEPQGARSAIDQAREVANKMSSPYFPDMHQPHQQPQQQHSINTETTNYHHQQNHQTNNINTGNNNSSSSSNRKTNQSQQPDNEVRNFVCTICSRAFKRKDKLKRHNLIHTGEKSHVCGICSKAFARRDKLTRHMRSHMNDKDYMCSVCPKSFTDNAGLSRHLKTHLGDKGYACSICNKAFYDNDNLLRHMKTHNNKSDDAAVLAPIVTSDAETLDSLSTFKCNFCSKLFKQDHYLKAHIMTYHGSNSQPTASS